MAQAEDNGKSRESGLFVVGKKSTGSFDAARMATTDVRVYNRLIESLVKAGQRIDLEYQGIVAKPIPDYLKRKEVFDHAHWKVVSFQPIHPEGASSEADLELLSGATLLNNEELDQSAGKGSLPGATDLIGGFASVQYLRSGTDFLHVNSLKHGRKVSFYIACNGIYKWEVEDALQTIVKSLRGEHSPLYPEGSSAQKGTLIEVCGVMEPVCAALDILMKHYSASIQNSDATHPCRSSPAQSHQFGR